MSQDDDEEGEERRRNRDGAPKERVLHTRVPAVLDQELKRLAHSLRVPVSNVVRAILEDALDAVDTVGERAEGGLLGFVERLSRQRDELRTRVRGERDEDGHEAEEEAGEREHAEGLCPDERPELLEGVYGYQPMVLAADGRCSVCGVRLSAGAEVQRALFDDPARRVFLGPECRLLPEKGS